MQRKLVCYAIGGDRGWEAICVDLDLAVQGSTFDEVYLGLKAAIREFVEIAGLEAPAQTAMLLRRRAPFSVRLMHKIGFLWTWLRNGPGDDGHAAGFTVACSM